MLLRPEHAGVCVRLRATGVAGQAARAGVLRPRLAGQRICGAKLPHQHPCRMPMLWRPRMGPAPAYPSRLPNHRGGVPAGAHRAVVQGGGGAYGRRPHSRSPRRVHAARVLMALQRARSPGPPRARAGERGRRRRPAARLPACLPACLTHAKRAIASPTPTTPRLTGLGLSDMWWIIEMNFSGEHA